MVANAEPTRREDVCVVVLTFNRRELLTECLEAVRAQTRAPDRVIVVDNASTDGTRELVRERFAELELLALTENSGPAGGFAAGIRAAHAGGHGWIWLMDDDTIPEPSALAELLAGAARAPAHAPSLLLASTVLWRDGRVHPMNKPIADRRRTGELAEAAGRGLLLLRHATWVSLLLRREAVDAFGLPPAHFFMWTEDVEYTSRILRDGHGYAVPESVVHHATATAHTFLDDRAGRFYFHARNYLRLLRGTSLAPAERPLAILWYVRTLAAYLRRRGFAAGALAVVARGVRDGLRGPAR